MSAPKTDPEKQTKRHWPALFGIGTSILWGLLLLLGLIAFLLLTGGDSEESADPGATGSGAEAGAEAEGGG